jgi:gliding motility-associated lipoprotein GldD
MPPFRIAINVIYSYLQNKKMNQYTLLILLISGLLTAACQEERIPIPKPRIYPKVEYPTRNYVALDKNYCQFSFQYPDYMVFEQDTTLINQQAKHACWFNLKIPSLNGVLHFTYTDISGGEVGEKLFETIKDSYDLTEKHNRKATGRRNMPFEDPENQLFGIKYSVEGDVASPYHFIVTDSAQHAVWAALYFNDRPNADSMRPVLKFVEEDIDKMINSFEWEQK